MTPQKSKRSNLIEFLLIFAIVYIVSQLVFRQFFPQESVGPQTETGVTLQVQSARVKGEASPVLILKNSTANALALPDRCPLPPLNVFRVTGSGAGERVEALGLSGSILPCVALTSVPPGKEVTIDLGPWKTALFSDYATYEVRLPAEVKLAEGKNVTSARFSVYEPGTFTQIFRAFITKPLLNALIFIASLVPSHNLGIAIIILTILVKLILFIPTQHALEGQRKMQMVQPRLDEIRRLHKNDPQKMQAETMRVWKEEGINPFQSCLPTLVQFPVLIGLFFVIRDANSGLSPHVVYPMFQNISWSFNPWFLGLNLAIPYPYLFPPLLAVAQFIQMKLTFTMADRKKSKAQSAKPVEEGIDQAKLQQKMMLYGLPLMIGFFGIQFPGAVCLYWLVSTLFAIGQQIIVNREHLKV